MNMVWGVPTGHQPSRLGPHQMARAGHGSPAARVIVLTVIGTLLTFPLSTASASSKKVTLDNGVTVLLGGIPGATYVAVEALYPVGIYHDPKGMTQASQLLERIVSEGGSNSFPPGDAIARITQFGKANAAVLPFATHFNYILPPEKLNLALKIEADRLASLEITKEIIEALAPKCYEEIDVEERIPQGGMIRHAFMAIVQGWRDNAKRVSLRSGLETLSVQHLRIFKEHYFRPENLTLVIVGKFNESSVIADVTRHFGSIPKANPVAPSLVVWDSVPKSHSISWDGRFAAVCLSFAPPSDPVDRMILTMWGALLRRNIEDNFDLQTASASVVGTMPNLPVGPMPFFLYATARNASELTKVRQLLEKTLQDAIRNPPTEKEVSNLNMIAKYYSEDQIPNWDRVVQQGEAMAKMMKTERLEGIQKGLTDVAHRWGVREITGVADATKLMVKASPDAKRIHRVLKKYLDSSQQHITELIPR